jgi:hypothetical protein
MPVAQQPNTPIPTDSLRQDVPRIVRKLREFSQALQGEADRLKRETNAQPDYLLLERSANAIIHAACVELLQFLFDLKAIVPAAAGMIDEHAAYLGSRKAGNDEHSTSETPDSTTESSNDSPTVSVSDEADLTWRHHVTRVHIERMLLDHARDGDPAEARLVEERKLKFRLLAGVWSRLSAEHPESLSPEAARIKNELLPGVDPWLGQARDFVKTAWVLDFLAGQIEGHWDRLTIKEAADEYHVRRTYTIWRACQPKANGKPPIEVVGRVGNQLLITRTSFLKWHQGQLIKNAEKAQRVPKVPPPRSYMCTRLECNWISEGTMPHPPMTCPRCRKRSVRPLSSPRNTGGGSKRN